ncbi:nucleotide sugar dehydrogenase [Candidatus Woesearchaeota archaeon]|nr:nucleotide sugar dehydrogenase [Candidatus Woesearchaeota archaeon]
MTKTITVVGLGYVGLPVACLCAEKGYEVYGLDIDKNKADLINKGESPIDDEYVKNKLKNLKDKIKATTNANECISNSDVVIVCVPTPVDRNNSPDLTALMESVSVISKFIKQGTLLIIESTVYSGIVEELVLPILKKQKLDALKNNVLVAHCPERIDPGNKKWNVENLPRVVGGITKEATKKAADFYRRIINADVVELSSVKAAEATKIMENTFRDINIAFVNEMAKSFDKAGIDIIEVIKGASTKPFAFMPHYPGAGVGGHCFDRNEWIFVKYEDSVYPIKIGELYELLKYYNETEIGETKLVCAGNLEILSFDLNEKKSCYKPLKLLSKRAYNKMLKIKAAGNYSIKITDKHPVIVFNDGFKIKPAEELGKNDKLVVSLELPKVEKEVKIDIIENIDENLAKKIRIKLIDRSFRNYKEALKPHISSYKYHDDFFRYDMLPLNYFLKAEKTLKVPREQIYLCTGRGPDLRKVKAILRIDEEFSRLIGYYLSEGCLTEDKTLRIRFTFNENEIEYINDLKDILDKKGFTYSEYLDRKNHAYHIKVPSEILGIIIRDVLKCGTNCYNMTIPPKLFSMPKNLRTEVIKGILRGDAGVTYSNKKRSYKKSGKNYVHNNNTADVQYFTSSSKLKQQVMLMLQDSKLMPRIDVREGLIRLHGAKNIGVLKDLFLGNKQEKLRQYLNNIKKLITYPDVEIFDTFATIKIKGVEELPGDYVYSLEVEDTGTVVTTNGLIMHNCIPVDPYYLIEKAKQIGFNHEFLKLARTINNSMPHYTVELLEAELKRLKKSIKGAKIGVLGIAYKANVDDTRESPAFEIISILKTKGAEVFVFDPHVKNGSNIGNLDDLLSKSDCIILATDHDEFKSMDLKKLKDKKIYIVIDGRNCLDKEKIKSMGILYHGIGRS